MSRLLLRVEDRFYIEKRGLLLAPLLDSCQCEGIPMSINVQLHKPDGAVLAAIAKIGIMFDCNRPLVLILPGLKAADVPVGTEIWFDLSMASSKQG
jgi:hypothetical protein